MCGSSPWAAVQRTIVARDRRADSGVWTQQLAEAGRAAPVGIARMSAPWYPTTGSVRPSSTANRIALETIRPVTSETATSRAIAARIGVARPRADDEVVADQRPVDVERDQPDREGGLAGSIGVRITPVARCGRPAAGRRGPPRRRHASRAGPFATSVDDRLALVGADLEQGHAALGQGLRQSLEQPADDLEPVRPAVEGDDRLERRGDRQPGDGVAADVRQVRDDDVVRIDDDRRQEVRLEEREAVGDRVTDRVLAGEVQRLGRDVDGDGRHLAGRRRRRRSATSSAMAIAPLPVPTSTIRIGGEPTGRAAAASRRITSASASSTSRSVSGRGMSARRVDREGQAVELLDPPDVRDGLAGRAPVEGRPVGRLGVGADRRVGVREDRGPVDPDGMPEQELGVEARRLRTGGGEPLDPVAQQRPDRGHGRVVAITAGS